MHGRSAPSAGIGRRACLIGGAAGILAACTAPPPSERPGGTGSEAETVAEGFEAPWSLVVHEGIALVSERDSGRVLEVSAGGEVREVDRIEGVAPRGEGGLLGLAVHEEHLFVYLTTGEDNRIVRLPVRGEAGALALGPAEVVLEGLAAARIHNGGRLGIGPDQMLYATVGDAGTPDLAQDPGSLNGKILRMTPAGAAPPDNPFPGSLVWSLGRRNPQGLAWDEDGVLYASEFGQSTWDELNVIEPGGNYGWPIVEGAAGDGEHVDPVQQWSPAEASPSGIAIAGGAIHVANLRGERLRSVPLTDLSASTERLVGTHGRLRDVALAPDGSLWVLTSTTDGRGEPAEGGDRILRLSV